MGKTISIGAKASALDRLSADLARGRKPSNTLEQRLGVELIDADGKEITHRDLPAVYFLLTANGGTDDIVKIERSTGVKADLKECGLFARKAAYSGYASLLTKHSLPDESFRVRPFIADAELVQRITGVNQTQEMQDAVFTQIARCQTHRLFSMLNFYIATGASPSTGTAQKVYTSAVLASMYVPSSERKGTLVSLQQKLKAPFLVDGHEATIDEYVVSVGGAFLAEKERIRVDDDLRTLARGKYLGKDAIRFGIEALEYYASHRMAIPPELSGSLSAGIVAIYRTPIMLSNDSSNRLFEALKSLISQVLFQVNPEKFSEAAAEALEFACISVPRENPDSSFRVRSEMLRYKLGNITQLSAAVGVGFNEKASMYASRIRSATERYAGKG